MILTPELIKLRLKKLGVHAAKYLGQHFLIDEHVLATIISKARQIIRPADAILEVGPGLGVLTRELGRLSKPVIAIEKDPIFADSLGAFLNHPNNLTVIKGDILDLLAHFPRLPNRPLPIPDSWTVVANIPYAITSPLLRKLFYHLKPPHDVLILVQKELAERICAQAGNRHRGLLTVEVEIMAETKIITNVPPSSFWPPPEVDSALIHLKLRPKPLVLANQLDQVLRIVTAGFSAKRKQLVNSLGGGLSLSAEDAHAALIEAGIDPTRRAETLTIFEWLTLAQRIKREPPANSGSQDSVD